MRRLETVGEAGREPWCQQVPRDPEAYGALGLVSGQGVGTEGLVCALWALEGALGAAGRRLECTL